MNKKIIISIVILLLLAGAAVFWSVQKGDQAQQKQQTVEQQEEKLGQVYKKISFSNDGIEVSFEIPESWFIETRFVNENKMTAEQLRNFLMTKYDGDPKKNPDSYISDYALLSWNESQDMSFDQLLLFVKQRKENLGAPYPVASVSTRNPIAYIGPNRYQIDFYIEKEVSFDRLREKVEEGVENDEFYQLNPSHTPTINDTQIKNFNALMVHYPTKTDEKGFSVFSPDAPGGDDYYIELTDGRYLKIKRQSNFKLVKNTPPNISF